MTRGSTPISKREKTILRALVDGGSIAAAARQVGLSERHTRRLVLDMIERLQVSSVYGLIAQAATAGVIEAALPADAEKPIP